LTVSANRITLPAMAPYMICVLPFQTSVGTIRRLRISVPLIEGLIDGVRYFRPDDLPPASGEELRPLLRPRITVRPPPSKLLEDRDDEAQTISAAPSNA
jgi:hypothetical protein